MPTETREPELNLEDVLGVNVKKMFLDWFEAKYVPAFRKRYGEDANIAAVLLDPRLGWFERIQLWNDVMELSNITVFTDSSEAGLIVAKKPGGTWDSAQNKLRPCLRYLCPSRDMERRLECLRVGDFPWEGADENGGVSGLEKEEDAVELERLVRKLRKLLRKVNKAAHAKANSLEGTPEYDHGAKYYRGGINVADQFPGYEAEPKAA